MDSLLPQALYIGDDDNDDECRTNPNEIPSTGLQYLKQVISERAQCQEVVTAKVDRRVFKNMQNVFAEEPPSKKNAPISIKPTKEWQTFQVADFSDARIRLAKIYTKNTSIHRLKTFPNVHEAKYEEWKNFFVHNQPTLPVVLGMKQIQLERSLEILVTWLEKSEPELTVPQIIGQWLYAVLVCLRQPLLSEVHSNLRDLARKCADMRSRLDPKDEKAVEMAAPLNLFICIVARYFRQIDLAD